jgi:hypothetical protein
VDITETSGVIQEGNHAAAKNSAGEKIEIELNSFVSMNMWGFMPSLFTELESGFIEFLSNLQGNELKKEYLLPEAVGHLIKTNKAEVHVLKTSDRWFGVTYKEDKEKVVKSFQALVDQGIYPAKLFK